MPYLLTAIGLPPGGS